MSDQTIKQKVDEFLMAWTRPADWLEMTSHHNNLLREIFDEIERRAETNMMKTHKLEGMHYAALKEVREELGVRRK